MENLSLPIHQFFLLATLKQDLVQDRLGWLRDGELKDAKSSNNFGAPMLIQSEAQVFKATSEYPIIDFFTAFESEYPKSFCVPSLLHLNKHHFPPGIARTAL